MGYLSKRKKKKKKITHASLVVYLYIKLLLVEKTNRIMQAMLHLKYYRATTPKIDQTWPPLVLEPVTSPSVILVQ